MTRASTGFCTLDSPWGPVTLRLRDGRLRRVEPGVDRRSGPACALPAALATALNEYFRTGEIAVPAELDLEDCSEFDRAVYAQLLHVRAGSVTTYGEMAGRVGNPGAARAVGGALGRNPLPLLVPCHRVIRADNRLGGFSAGLEWKRRLLRHEGWTIDRDRVIHHD